MSKRTGKFITFVLACFITFTLSAYDILAADAVNVTVSGGEASVGGEVEVTLTLSGNKETIAVTDLWITYDASILEAVSGYDQGGGGKIRILSSEGKTTYTLKFKALAAGTSNVELNAGQSIVGSLQTDRMELYTSSGSVSVKGAANLSKNNNLSALTVSPGTLTPAFSKDVTTYNITLTESCDRLTVSASTEDAKAKVSVWGAAMDPGDNTTKITVTAENGDTKVYTIYTKVPAAVKKNEEPVIITMDDHLYNLVNNFDEELLPEGYETADYTYKNKKITVAKGISNGKILFCVSDAATEKSEPQFVVYDEQLGSFSPLQLITVKGGSYTAIDVTALNSADVPQGYSESEYVLNNVSYKVYINAEKSMDSFIIYCSNVNGESGWYRYDIKEGTMQRAFIDTTDTAAEETSAVAVETESAGDTETADDTGLKEEYDNYVKKTKIALGLMAFLLVAVVIVVIIFIVKSFRDEDGYDDEDDSDNESGHRKKSSDDDITFIG